MNNKKWMNIALVVLPLIAVVLAGMPNSVTVYQMAEGVASAPVTCSMFTLIEDVDAAACLPYSAICGGLTFGLAVIWLVRKKASLLKWIFGASFAATTLAVVPLLLRGDVVLVPNMLIPVLLGVECMLAFGMMKMPAPEESVPKGKRLS